MAGGRIITPGELAIGQFVTAYEIKVAASGYGDDPHAAHLAAQITRELQGLKGAIYEVLDTDLPYIAARGIAGGGRVVLDTRSLVLMEVRKEFVQRLLAATTGDAADQSAHTERPTGFNAMTIMARERAIAELITDLNNKRAEARRVARRNMLMLLGAVGFFVGTVITHLFLR